MKGSGGFIAIALILAGAFLIFAPVNNGKPILDLSQFGIGSTVDDGTPSSVTNCDSTTTPDIDPNCIDIENLNTAFTEGTNVYRRVGDTAWTTFTQGTAITGLIVGERYEMLFGVTTSDMTDNAYGPHIITDPVPCVENVPFADTRLYDDSIETALTATFYDENHDASEQAVGANDYANVYLKWEAGSEDYFGNPYLPDSTPNVLCLDLNTTEFDEPDWVMVDGVEMKKVGTPSRHAASTGDIAYCYEAPIITDAGVEFKVRLDTDDTVDPAGDSTAYLYAANWYINTDTNNVEYGVEDDQGNAVGTDASDSLSINVS